MPVIPVRMTETWALAHLWVEEVCRKWLADNASVGRLRALEKVSDPNPHRAGPARTSHLDRRYTLGILEIVTRPASTSLNPRARLSL